MTEQDFIIGEPNRSQRIMVTKTEKPRPKYSGDPQGSALGAEISGHRSKKSTAVEGEEQGPVPPIQFLKPLWMSFTPIRVTVGPVTMGGKMRNRMRGGTKARMMRRMAVIAPVPRMAPGSKLADDFAGKYVREWAGK